MCRLHHKVIDDDPESYTVARLQEIKRKHEELKREDEGPEKYLDVVLKKSGYFLIAKAINKSKRPIVVTHYRFLFPSYSTGEGIDGPYSSGLSTGKTFKIKSKAFIEALKKATENIKPYREIARNPENYPITLKDGESLKKVVNFGELINVIEEGLKMEQNYDLSTVKCCFYTNDGDFCTETIDIKSDIEYFIEHKRRTNITHKQFKKIFGRKALRQFKKYT